ncbi:hypothetical protein ASC97_05560 [Rhizobium sp. Root1203]|uniref:hypothetical protein n=1 Tax=Rhizobium sp. Root1203 TaxID=1736427 RepID=UPI00070AA157|nr:hypothetical protein [Rhizobium sp. Root1203]KQV27833.1 hypothetical protein ASC97_05560 [Rhizobium sp. Root1203]
MIEKALIVVCAVLLLSLGGLALLSHSRGQTIDTLTAEKAMVQQKLDQANANLEVSTANHDRIVAEKDALLKSELAKAQAEKDVAVRMASIKKDIDDATDGTACGNSGPFDALFDGLRLLQGAGLGVTPGDRIQIPGQSGPAAPKPGHPTGAGQGRVR